MVMMGASEIGSVRSIVKYNHILHNIQRMANGPWAMCHMAVSPTVVANVYVDFPNGSTVFVVPHSVNTYE